MAKTCFRIFRTLINNMKMKFTFYILKGHEQKEVLKFISSVCHNMPMIFISVWYDANICHILVKNSVLLAIQPLTHISRILWKNV